MSAGGRCHSLGLRSDGTAVAAGWDDDGRCRVSSGRGHTPGVRAEGTVLSAGDGSAGQRDDGVRASTSSNK